MFIVASGHPQGFAEHCGCDGQAEDLAHDLYLKQRACLFFHMKSDKQTLQCLPSFFRFLPTPHYLPPRVGWRGLAWPEGGKRRVRGLGKRGGESTPSIFRKDAHEG